MDARRMEQSHQLTIDDLGEDLQEEILLRLPVESAFRCCLVSKHWREIVSNPGFARRFASLRDQIHIENPFLLLLDSRYWKQVSVLNPGEISVFKSFQLSLNFIPNIEEGIEKQRLRVAAFCNDLLLCYKYVSGSRFTYYICNPMTKKWVELPPLLERLPKRDYYGGFIWDQNGAVVVHLSGYHSSGNVQGWKFSSETGTWTGISISYPLPSFYYYYMSALDVNMNSYFRSFGPLIFPLTAYNGRLYWIADQGVVEYDPYSHCLKLFGYPTRDMFSAGVLTASIGFCRGVLRFAQLVYDSEFQANLHIWELKENDCGKGGREWRLEYKVRLSEMDLNKKSFVEVPKRVMGFHPHDRDIVYLECHFHVIWCNMRQKTLQYLEPIMPLAFDHLFGLVLPWWPSPVPQISVGQI